MNASSPTAGYSAQVAIELRLPERTVRVAQMGPDFLLLAEPVDQAPCEAVVVLKVDQVGRSWSVFLPEGIAAGSLRVPLAHVEKSATIAA